MQGFQADQLIVDDARLHGATAWRVDEQHHGLGIGVFKSGFCAFQNVLGIGICIVGNHALHINDSGMGFNSCSMNARGGSTLEQQPDRQGKKCQPCQAHAHFPAPCGTLFVDGRQNQFFQGGPFPVGGWLDGQRGRQIGHGGHFHDKNRKGTASRPNGSTWIIS